METSLFDRIFGKKHPAWLVLLASILLLLVPVGSAALDGVLSELYQQGRWWILFLPPAILIYIGLVSPRIAHLGEEAIHAIQPYTSLDAEAFAALVRKASATRPSHEVLIFLAGALIGFFSALAGGFDEQAPILRIYWYASNSVMYGVLAWAIFVSILSTRVNAAMHRQALRIDLFDQTPFDAVGRQSLLLALVFIGGITISILFSLQIGNLLYWGSWLGYLGMILVTVLIFFFSMYPTHKVLSKARQAELEPLRKLILKASRELVQRLKNDEPAGDLPAQISALSLYEQRLQAVRTWPYNTAMLRTLFFSVFIPLLTVLVRRAAEVIFLSNP